MIINRYFSFRLARIHIEVSLLFAAMLFVIRLVSELKRIRLGYSSADAIIYVFCMLPSSIARYESMIVCLATCIWFLQLRRSQELLMAQVFGVSMTKLCMRMLPAMIVIVAMFSLNREWIAPSSSEYAKEQRARKASGGRMYVQDNQMWIRTDDGFLQAIIGKNANKIRNVRYYVFEDDHLKKWQMMPDAVYRNGLWIGRNVKEFHMGKEKQIEKERLQVKLPIGLKPRVISWSFLKPEYLSLRQIIVSLSKGSKFGISENMTWLLMAARAMRPVNMLCIMWLACSIMDKAVAMRLAGVSWRIGMVMLISSIEFFVYEFMTQRQTGLTLINSCLVAGLPATILLTLIISIALFRRVRQS
ncbi:MAG: LptF/LptG family permease [Pseudomonadota bacterium]|nr:LptF/LptG family permease [Pseudomonadota bacterium]